ncbi:MAG: DUF2946 domain-containing protein [Pseudomonadota bacterium]
MCHATDGYLSTVLDFPCDGGIWRGMRRDVWIRWGNPVLAIALVLQLLGPVNPVARADFPFDVYSFVCASTDERGVGLAATDSRDATDNEHHDQEDVGEHCPLCTVGASAVLPAPSIKGFAVYASQTLRIDRLVSRHSVGATGPPLGGRAPPLL